MRLVTTSLHYTIVCGMLSNETPILCDYCKPIDIVQSIMQTRGGTQLKMVGSVTIKST